DWLDNFMAVRDHAGSTRFIDVSYKDLLESAAEMGAQVLEKTGIPMSTEIQNGMEEWIEANRREHRAAHKYTLADFGLNKDT
ncbi:MAG: sulfotransferase, partial [Maricaulaceae bacterium]